MTASEGNFHTLSAPTSTENLVMMQLHRTGSEIPFRTQKVRCFGLDTIVLLRPRPKNIEAEVLDVRINARSRSLQKGDPLLALSGVSGWEKVRDTYR